eukprot:scaffold43083_cov61-Phaeocystis_antarctica.AAC.5
MPGSSRRAERVLAEKVKIRQHIACLVGRSQVATCCGIDCDGRPMLSVPSAPRLLATCSPLANAGLASLMLPTSLLPEFSSPDFSLSLLPATLSTQSCFLGEPFAREALLRGTTGVASRDHASIFGPETRPPLAPHPTPPLAQAPGANGAGRVHASQGSRRGPPVLALQWHRPRRCDARQQNRHHRRQLRPPAERAVCERLPRRRPRIPMISCRMTAMR